MLVVDEPLVTDRLLLRAFRPGDLEALHEIRTDPAILRYLYWPPGTVETTREVIRQRRTMNRVAEEGDFLVLAAERRDTGRMVGEVDLHWASAAHRQAEIGVILHRDAHGRGYAAEAAAALLDLAFHRLGMHRVSARTDARNEAAVRALRRLGLRQEAHLRQCVTFAGAWHDELIFAILAEEWPAAPRSVPWSP
ncbi:MAG TPA: GNAT family protein [Pilimelia sp.]|nr:GNAT family protein [Pilimelia sp.]